MNYWHKLSQRFAIKIALPHLLLGVMAASFSLSNQSVIPTNQPINHLVTITTVMASLQDSQNEAVVANPFINELVKSTSNIFVSHFALWQVDSVKPVRLTPYNGIRAGPLSLLA
ncbi:hypothetical protein RCS94_01455 [Orbaceae bacterium ac157xtp]